MQKLSDDRLPLVPLHDISAQSQFFLRKDKSIVLHIPLVIHSVSRSQQRKSCLNALLVAALGRLRRDVPDAAVLGARQANLMSAEFVKAADRRVVHARAAGEQAQLPTQPQPQVRKNLCKVPYDRVLY